MSLKRKDLKHIGSLVTIVGTSNCLGDLIHFEGKGTYDATHGKVPLSEEEADAHNQALDKARLEGLDKNCEIGQAGTFYFVRGRVTTFLGTVVDPTPEVRGKSITFRRAGKVYRGRTQKDASCFNFKRIS